MNASRSESSLPICPSLYKRRIWFLGKFCYPYGEHLVEHASFDGFYVLLFSTLRHGFDFDQHFEYRVWKLFIRNRNELILSVQWYGIICSGLSFGGFFRSPNRALIFFSILSTLMSPTTIRACRSGRYQSL